MPELTAWKWYEKIAFRFFFVYSIICIIPVNPSYFQNIFSIHWSALKIQDIGTISNYLPALHTNERGNDLFGLLFVLLISIVQGLGWGLLDRSRKNYSVLYYWMRVAIRYKLAAVLLYYSLIKVFPQQMPYPTLSWLNTNLGDFTAGRLYWITTGVSQGYEIFIGILETITAVLLFFRRTVTLAALVYLGIIINITAINFFFDTGILTISVNLAILTVILLAYNARKLWEFLILHKTLALNDFVPVFGNRWQQTVRMWTKMIFILFFFGFRSFKTYNSYSTGGFRLPISPGLPGISGFYRVQYFQMNHQIVSPSEKDTVLWQNVVFESWNSLSIKVAHPVRLSVDTRMTNYEVFSTVGREYFSYQFDTSLHNLVIENENTLSQQYYFQYRRPDSITIELSGVDSHSDSLYIGLRRMERRYPLIEGRYEDSYMTY